MTTQLTDIPLEAIARNAGYDAFNAGLSTSPVESPAMRDMVQRMPVGGKMLALYAEFKAGYFTAATHSFAPMHKAG